MMHFRALVLQLKKELQEVVLLFKSKNVLVLLKLTMLMKQQEFKLYLVR
jgi:hypothetical protein